MEKHSLCFDCSNAYAHRCQKIFDGTPIEGWTAQELDDGWYMVLQCPNFIKDWDHRIKANDLSRMLGISLKSVWQRAPQELIAIAKEKGLSPEDTSRENVPQLLYLQDLRWQK